MTAHNPSDFPVSTFPGEQRRAREIRCGACPQVGYLRDNSVASLPDNVIAKKFRQQGWLVGARPKAHRCPACIAKPGPRGLAIVPQETPMPAEAATPLSVVKADPPPTLTPPVRRRIADYLDSAYDTGAERYRGNVTDEACAGALKVPRAWVAEVREAMYGPEANEEAEIRGRAVADLEARIGELEGNMLTMLDATETAIKSIRADLARLKS